MKKLNEKMIKRYGEIYKRMYDNEEDTFEKSHLFDEKFELDIDFRDLVRQYNKFTKRLIDSDRECAAFYEMYTEKEINVKVNNEGKEKEISGYSYKDIEDNLLDSDYMNEHFIWSYLEHYIGGRTYKYLNKKLFSDVENMSNFLKEIVKEEYLNQDFIDLFMKSYLEEIDIDEMLEKYVDEHCYDEICDIYSIIECDYYDDIENDLKIFMLKNKISGWVNKEDLKKYLSYNEYKDLEDNNKLDEYLKKLDDLESCEHENFINKNFSELKYNEYENILEEYEEEYCEEHYDEYLKNIIMNISDEDMVKYLIENINKFDYNDIEELFDIFVNYHNMEIVNFEDIFEYIENDDVIYINNYDYRYNIDYNYNED